MKRLPVSEKSFGKKLRQFTITMNDTNQVHTVSERKVEKENFLESIGRGNSAYSL
jgi:hypothetical protein